jgi:hypothetical protein
MQNAPTDASVRALIMFILSKISLTGFSKESP